MNRWRLEPQRWRATTQQQPTTAGLMLGLAIGLRLGLQWGRLNSVRERARRAEAQRARDAEQPPPFDPVQAKAEYDSERRWCRSMGRAARKPR